jgi:hypothetical protein
LFIASEVEGWPAAELVPGRALAQQAGQLADVRFFDPAPAVPAARIGAGLTGAALTDLAALPQAAQLPTDPTGEPVIYDRDGDPVGLLLRRDPKPRPFQAPRMTSDA